MRNIFCLIVVLSILMAAGCVQQFRTQNLQHAAAVGSVSEVRRHLDAGADVNGKDRGWSALALAAVYGQADVVPVLIEAGAELDGTDSNTRGVTPLSLAAWGGNDDVVDLLLDAGADPEIRDTSPYEMNALEAAVTCRHLSTVRLLLSRGVSPIGEGEPKWPPLVGAAFNDDVAIIEELLKHGAGEDAEMLQLAAEYASSAASTAAYEALVAAGAKAKLTEAAGAGSMKLTQRLLNGGASPDGPPGAEATPLYAAAAAGHADIAEALMEAGAAITAKTGGWTPLATAVHYGHDDVARLLLDAGADINSREGHPHRRTPLEIAVECQHLSTVELLLERGAALEPSQLSYWPIIVEAATRGDAAIVRVLLAHGAGESPAFVQKAADHAAVNAHEAAYRLLIDHGASPTLTSVAALGYEKQVREFLEAGTDPDETGSVYPAPLHAAAGQGHVAIVRMLLDAGANPEQSTRYTALGAAAMQGQQEVVRVLVEAGADVNGVGDRGVGQPPLECAIEAEDAEMVGLLLELGADPCLKREYPWMPLEVAARLGNVEILQMLIDTGLCSDADLRVAAHAALEQDNTAAYDMLAGSGAELTLAMAAQRGDPAAVERLIAEGADVNAASESGSPPLLLASGGGHTDIVRALLSAGADVEAVDRGDGTALHYAATAGHVEVARMLIEAGAVVSVSQRFCGTPLHEAAQGGHLAMIRLLVGSGADPDARSDYWKKRPLHSAIWAPNKTETITLLVELGANPNAATDQQVTPLHEAVKAADVEATRALLAVGADPDLPNSGGNSARDLARMFDLQEIVNIIDSHD